MIALQRVIRRVNNGKDGLVNILSDFRSSLEVLTGPKTFHPLAHEARRDITEIVAECSVVHLLSVRAHVEITGNERANELARHDTLTKKTAADYDKFLLSHAKRVIERRAWKNGKNDTPRKAWVKSPNASFLRWNMRTGFLNSLK
ncbi:hypothetical protein EVAR_71129_1 [Eumeta japonica]|uniref:Uncharacterized protein n=1 Tax=Eumeta variegata TaxID=151549 RepID=A0A4C1ZPR0_EUMVA|nr:hypothetical protein EVAR_71129_1 [Eumeta japonica]